MMLNKCPVCGRMTKDNTNVIIEMRFNPEEYAVYCSNCGCSTKYFKSEEGAINSWNKMCQISESISNEQSV